MRLSNKVCIVTGAGSGIGRAAAILFAREGATVGAADIDTSADGVTHYVDVAEERDTEALAAAALDEHGRIDVLFNNAGIAGVGDISETSADLWDHVMRVNTRGVFLMSRSVRWPCSCTRRANVAASSNGSVSPTEPNGSSVTKTFVSIRNVRRAGAGIPRTVSECDDDRNAPTAIRLRPTPWLAVPRSCPRRGGLWRLSYRRRG